MLSSEQTTTEPTQLTTHTECEIIPDMQEKHRRALDAAAAEYEQAAAAKEAASAKLAKAMRAAYADNEQQSAILRAARHVWSREYLRLVLGLAKKKDAGE